MSNRPTKSYDPDDPPSFFESRPFKNYVEQVYKLFVDGETYGEMKRRVGDPQHLLWEALNVLEGSERLIPISVSPMRWKRATEPARQPKRYPYGSSLGKISTYDPTKPTVSLSTRRRG